MIQLTQLKSLLLKQPSQPNRSAHLSAASGLVRLGPWLYVVADDELHLGKFLLEGHDAGELHRCFDGDLPIEIDDRKKEKPDVEVLTLIPQWDNVSQHSLLALGSGSKKNRCQGAIVPLDKSGNISSASKIIDLSFFYEFLKKEIGKLNIEGATVVDNNILLFQRGNKKNKLNAAICIGLDEFYRLLLQPHKYYEPHIQITAYDLGEIDEVPLCFTDATSLASGEIVFTACAENTSDSYLDGVCMGSVVGIIDVRGELKLLETINKKVKLEGIAASEKDKIIELLLVTDADDAAHPALLYSACIQR